MSLSDYDTMAFDENARPTNGTIEGFVPGTSCEIYKNWLYVHDEAAWADGRDYVKPTVAEVTSGVVSLAGFEIEAARGPQSAIFVKVTTKRYKEQKEGEPYQPLDVRRMAGLGCCGYRDALDLVREEEKLDPAEWLDFSTGGSFPSEGEPSLVFAFARVGGDETRDFERPANGAYETQWVGVLPSTLAAFIAWLKSDDDYAWEESEYRRWVDAIEQAEPLRANQGDMFFARHADVPLSVTPVGEQQAPVLEQIVEEMKKG